MKSGELINQSGLKGNKGKELKMYKLKTRYKIKRNGIHFARNRMKANYRNVYPNLYVKHSSFNLWYIL